MTLISAIAKTKGILRERKRRSLGRKYLFGNGIEIGALDNFLKVQVNTVVRYVDRMSTEDLLNQYPHLLNRSIRRPDVIDNGEKLLKFEEESLDFIIANHFIEHCEDPIGTLKTFLLKLRTGGIIYMAVPNKNYTLDKKRPLTTNVHLWTDHIQGPETSREQHYEEAAEHWHFRGETTPEAIKGVSGDLLKKNYSIHFHVWDKRSFYDFLTFFRKKTELNISILCQQSNFDETIFVVQKRQ